MLDIQYLVNYNILLVVYKLAEIESIYTKYSFII
jgi:hypothetical protein